MNYLLDTHVFLWWISDHRNLSLTARSIIENPANHIYLSAASCWEIVIKTALGRLELPDKADTFVSEQIALNGFSGLPIHLSHAFALQHLPPHHKDPFDRMLIAQARTETFTLVTNDLLIARYDVQRAW